MSHSYISSIAEQHHHQQQHQKHVGGFYSAPSYPDVVPFQPQTFLQSWRNYPSPEQQYVPRPSYIQYAPPHQLQNHQQQLQQQQQQHSQAPIHQQQYSPMEHYQQIEHREDQKPLHSPEEHSPPSFIPSPPLQDPSVAPNSPPQTLGDLLNFRSAESYQRTYARPTLTRSGSSEEGALFGCLPFISKLRGLLADEDKFSDVLRWDTSGTLFIVHHTANRLKSTILPDTYGHANYPSFTRQLNIYGFRRLTATQLNPLLDLPEEQMHSIIDYHGWVHSSFLRDNPSLSVMMKPRTSFARRVLKEEKEKKSKAAFIRNAGGKAKFDTLYD